MSKLEKGRHSKSATGINTVAIRARRQLLLSLSGLLHQYLRLGSLKEGIPEDSEVVLASMGSCQLLTSLVLFLCCHLLSTAAWYSHIDLGCSYFIDLLEVITLRT